MLYLVTSQPPLCPGTYHCEQISSEEAAVQIKTANLSDALRPYVNFGSTRFAIQKLTGIKVELVRKVSLPAPKDGDIFIDVRLKPDAVKGQPELSNLQFFKIKFSSPSGVGSVG